MNLFVKIELSQWLNNPFKPAENYPMESRQINLFYQGRLKMKEQKICPVQKIKEFFIYL
jgi:hypothetical protein